MVVEEKEIEIAPGAFIWAFTFNGTVPGPVIVVHEGDYVELTLVNPAGNQLLRAMQNSRPVTKGGSRVNEKGRGIMPRLNCAWERDRAVKGASLAAWWGSSPLRGCKSRRSLLPTRRELLIQLPFKRTLPPCFSEPNSSIIGSTVLGPG